MKKFIIASYLFFCGYNLYAQDQNIEAAIKSLEQTEVQAVLAKDTVALKKIWDNNYIVNNPDNKIILAKLNSVDRPVLQKQKVSFAREVEQVLINGDVAISMGNETVVPISDDVTKPGQTIKRRYTNIWMKKDGSWKLVARHANVICQ
jgi:ketosteroid isomerase-like protein